MKSKSTLKLKTGEITSEQALEWFRQTDFYSTPPYFITHWKTGKQFFHFEGSLLAFEKTNRHYILTGEPAALNSANLDTLYSSFLSFAHTNKKKVCGYYVGHSWNHKSFVKRPLGTSFRLDLESYDFNLSKAKEVRRSLRKGQSSKYKIIESSQIDERKLQALIKKWQSKKLPLKLKFFLSKPQRKSSVTEYENWYAIEKNGHYYAFCSTLSYVHKGRKGIYLDHLAYDPLAEKSALSFLLSSLLYNLKHEGVPEMNLGLNPFAKINPTAGSTEKLFSHLYRMPILYRPKGLHYFKGKFAGQEEHEYFFYEKNSSPWLSLFSMVKASFKS